MADSETDGTETTLFFEETSDLVRAIELILSLIRRRIVSSPAIFVFKFSCS